MVATIMCPGNSQWPRSQRRGGRSAQCAADTCANSPTSTLTATHSHPLADQFQGERRIVMLRFLLLAVSLHPKWRRVLPTALAICRQGSVRNATSAR